MPLSPAQRVELDKLGPDVVRLKFGDAVLNRRSDIGLKNSLASRHDVEDWLAEQDRKAAKQQAATLWWARASAWIAAAGIIVAVILALVGL